MKKILTGALAVATLAGALTATTALPAAAAPHGGGYHAAYHGGYGGYRGGYRGGYYRGGGWGGGTAVGALAGLAVGAAIAGGGYYAPAPYYYAPPCRIEMRWNPYWGGYERVRVCY